MQIISSKVSTAQDFFDDNSKLSGKEKFKMIGNSISEKQLKQIISQCSDLKECWDCLEKSKRAQQVIGKGNIILGSLMVFSSDFTSSYGYYFNPPFEFHAWVELDNGDIVDVALPGVIKKGLNTSDEQGPFIIGRKPVVLAGKPLNWMKYEKRIIYVEV